MAVSVVLGVSMLLASCGTADKSTESAAAVSLSCDGDLAEIVKLLRSGLPTYDYDPASDLTELVQRSDAVVSGTVDKLVRIAEPDNVGPDSPGNDSWTTITSTDAQILVQQAGAAEGPVSVLSIDAKWSAREPDPLSAPVSVTGLAYVAFVQAWPMAPGGLVTDVQGLYVGCAGSNQATRAVIEPLPDDARGLSIDAVAAEVIER